MRGNGERAQLSVELNRVESGSSRSKEERSQLEVPVLGPVRENAQDVAQVQFLDARRSAPNRLFNTVLNAVGVRKSDGSPVDDFGDASLPKGELSGLRAV